MLSFLVKLCALELCSLQCGPVCVRGAYEVLMSCAVIFIYGVPATFAVLAPSGNPHCIYNLGALQSGQLYLQCLRLVQALSIWYLQPELDDGLCWELHCGGTFCRI